MEMMEIFNRYVSIELPVEQQQSQLPLSTRQQQQERRNKRKTREEMVIVEFKRVKFDYKQ